MEIESAYDKRSKELVDIEHAESKLQKAVGEPETERKVLRTSSQMWNHALQNADQKKMGK